MRHICGVSGHTAAHSDRAVTRVFEVNSALENELSAKVRKHASEARKSETTFGTRINTVLAQARYESTGFDEITALNQH